MTAFLSTPALSVPSSNKFLSVLGRQGRPLCNRTPRRRSSSAMTMSSEPNFSGRRILLAKRGPDGVLGDCPFTQKANLALRFRGVPFEVETVDLANKPEWFLKLNEGGSTPTFVEDGLVLTSSDDIVEHADKVGTHGSPLNDSTSSYFESATKCVEPLFSSFVKLMKNKGDDAPLKAELVKVLEDINKHLEGVDGKFLLGKNVSALDCNLAPKLWHLSLAGKHYKGFEVPESLSALREYMRNMESSDEWEQTICGDEVVISGWSKFF